MNRNQKVAFQRRLMDWYAQHHRSLPWRDTTDPYAVWVSEVMLQQTQVNTVIPFYLQWMTRFPDIQRLSESDLQTVLKNWEGLGYYARARNLYRAAGIVMRRHHGRVPNNRHAFMALPGVGDYIASAVLSIAFNQPHAVVDGNVKRVLARLFLVDLPVNRSSSLKTFTDIAMKMMDSHTPGTYNQAIMELGALVCKPRRPGCISCPVKGHCLAYESGSVDDFPKRIKTKSVPEYAIAVGVVFDRDRVLITRRPSEGLLGGLWEFPGGKTAEGETPEAACIREIKEEVNLIVKAELHLTRVKHAYTHFKIVMDVFCCRYLKGTIRLNGPTDYRWVRLGELDKFPFPGANHKFIPLLKRRSCTGGIP